MRKRLLVGLIFGTIAISAGLYVYHEWKGTLIGALLKDPRQYEGKAVSIRGKVIDRTSLVVVKYFNLQDDTGEIRVVTDQPLPLVGETVRVKGRVREAFAVGDSQLVVFIEESVKPR